MSGRFVSVDRDTAYLLPPAVQEWLPKHHLARFVVEIVEQLNLGPLTSAYRGRGSDAFHPARWWRCCSTVYEYATGVFSGIIKAVLGFRLFLLRVCRRSSTSGRWCAWGGP